MINLVSSQMPVSVNLGGAIAPLPGASGGGVIPLPGNDFPLLINSSPIAPGTATAAAAPTASTAGGTITCGGRGRVLVTGSGGSGGHVRSGHASRESSTGPIRYESIILSVPFTKTNTAAPSHPMYCCTFITHLYTDISMA